MYMNIVMVPTISVFGLPILYVYVEQSPDKVKRLNVATVKFVYILVKSS